MQIGILTTGSEPAADKRLCETVTMRGGTPLLIDLMQCSLSLAKCQNAHIYYQNEPIESSVHVIIPRIDIPHTAFGLSVLRQFEALKIPVTDNVVSIEKGRDKLRCLQCLMHHNIPIPVTSFAYTQNDLVNITNRCHGEAPWVMKVIEGTEGNGVYLVHTLEEAYEIFHRHNQEGMRVIMQEFIGESAGEDLRCFVVDGEIVATMRRKSQTGDFRANIALGAHSFRETLSEEEEHIVLAATRAIKSNVAGVDFIRSKRGPLILEINTSPGITGEQGIESVTGVDVADAIVAYAEKCGKHRLLNGVKADISAIASVNDDTIKPKYAMS